MADELREMLNRHYLPLQKAGEEALRLVRRSGYHARLTWCNLHDVMVNGKYETEYFPLPEIELESSAEAAEVGISLDYSAWLELTITREAALCIDYTALAAWVKFTVYGAEDYLHDLYDGTTPPQGLKALLEKSEEQRFHLYFSMRSVEELSWLLRTLKQCAILFPKDAPM